MPDLVGGLWLVGNAEALRLSNAADEDATAIQFEVDSLGQLSITPISGEPIYLGAGLEVEDDAEFLSDVLVDGGARVTGNMGIGAALVATARLLLAAGSASLAPLAFNAGTLLTFPTDGRVEYDGSAYYATVGTDRQRLVREPGSTAITTVGTLSAGAVPYSLLTGTVPTWNQNTTGSAAKWTTARNLAGNSVDGSGNVAFANKFIVQGTADAGLSAAQFLGALSTGIVKNTITTGVLSIAVAGDFPTLNQNTSGSAATLLNTRTIWGQNFNGSANVTGSLTAVGDITGGASSMVLQPGTGNSRKLSIKPTSSGGTATEIMRFDDTGVSIGGGGFDHAASRQLHVRAVTGAGVTCLFEYEGDQNGNFTLGSNTHDAAHATTVSNNVNWSFGGDASDDTVLFGTVSSGLSTAGTTRSLSVGFVDIKAKASGNASPTKVVRFGGDGSTIFYGTDGTTVRATFAAASLTLATDLLFTDATYDIGKNGATRPRDGFYSRNVTIGGTLGTTGITTLGAPITLKGYTVATLPTGVQGHVAYCTDLLAPAFFAVVVGGGTVVGTVFYNGTNWVAI